MSKMFRKIMSLCLGAAIVLSALPLTAAQGTTNNPHDTTNQQTQQMDLSSAITNQAPGEDDKIVYDGGDFIVYETSMETSEDEVFGQGDLSEVVEISTEGEALPGRETSEVAEISNEGENSSEIAEVAEISDIADLSSEEAIQPSDDDGSGIVLNENDDRDLSLEDDRDLTGIVDHAGSFYIDRNIDHKFRVPTAGSWTITITSGGGSLYFNNTYRGTTCTVPLQQCNSSQHYPFKVTGSTGRSIVRFTYNGNGSGGGNSSQFQYIGTGSRSIYKGQDYGFQPPSAGDYEFTMTYNASSSWQIANTTRTNPVTLKNLQALSGTTQFYRVFVPGSGTCSINIQKIPEVTYIREGSSTVIKDRNYGFQPASAGDYEFQMTYNASSSWQIANTNRTNPAVLKGLQKLTGTTSFYRIYVPGSGSCTVRVTKIPEVTYIREGSSTVIKATPHKGAN